jgi:uncharacterized membrane protein YhdT
MQTIDENLWVWLIAAIVCYTLGWIISSVAKEITPALIGFLFWIAGTVNWLLFLLSLLINLIQYVQKDMS